MKRLTQERRSNRLIAGHMYRKSSGWEMRSLIFHVLCLPGHAQVMRQWRGRVQSRDMEDHFDWSIEVSYDICGLLMAEHTPECAVETFQADSGL